MVVIVCNILLPGLGTTIAGFLVGGDALANNIIVGVLQLYFTCIIVSWLWSVYTGYLIYKRTDKLIE